MRLSQLGRKSAATALAAAIMAGAPGLPCYQAAAQVAAVRPAATGAAIPAAVTVAPLNGLQDVSPALDINPSVSPPTLSAALPDLASASQAASLDAPARMAQPALEHPGVTQPAIASVETPSNPSASPALGVRVSPASEPEQASPAPLTAAGLASPAPSRLPAAAREAESFVSRDHREAEAGGSAAGLIRIFDGSAARRASVGAEAVPESGSSDQVRPVPFLRSEPGPAESTRRRVDSATLAGVPKDAIDDSEHLQRLIRQAREGASRPVPEEARRHRILIIPGLGWKLGGEAYAKPNLDILRAHGIDAQLIETDPLGTKEENALTVKAAIEASDKPVILWGHSKGGVDATEALLTYPELQQKVAKFLTTQSPYFGTPWADWLMKRPWIFDAMALFSKLTHPRLLRGIRVFGRRETPRQLTQAARAGLPREGSPFRKGLEVYSIGTQVRSFGLRSFLEWLKINVFHALPRRGSDGVIPAGNMILPGSRYAILDEVSHSDTFSSAHHFNSTSLVNENFQHGHFAADLTEAVLHWMFAKESFTSRPVAPPAPPHEAERDYEDFLIRTGFQSPDELTDLGDPTLAPLQREVLEHGQAKRNYFRAARKVAAKVMAGIAAQGYSAPALERGAKLAAELLDLRSLPEEKTPEAVTLDGLIDSTHGSMDQHLRRLMHDILRAAYGPTDLERLRQGDPAFRAELAELRGLVQDLLLTLYADPDIGHTRLAGRALAASLTRYARRHGAPEVENALEDSLAARGLRLGDYLGTRFEISDHKDAAHRFEVRTGDTVGRRTRDRSSSEIAAAVRPPWSRWWRAWRERVLGPIVAIWIDPVEEHPAQTPGQPVRNALRRLIHAGRRWLGGRRALIKGYSHTGVVDVREADGVSLAWVYHASVDSWEGRIYKSALMHDFVQRGHHVRFGLTRMDPERAREELLRQAADPALRRHPYFPKGEQWPLAVSPEKYGELKTLAESDPPGLLKELHRLAVRAVDRLMGLGIGYAFGFMDQALRAQCSSIMVLIYLLGAGFNRQPEQFQWHTVARVFAALGIANADGLRTDLPIIWPASFFVDSMAATHQYVELPGEEAKEDVPSVREEEPDAPLLRALGDMGVDREAVREAISSQLSARDAKRAGAVGWKTGLNDPPASSHFAWIERLWARRERAGARSQP